MTESSIKGHKKDFLHSVLAQEPLGKTTRKVVRLVGKIQKLHEKGGTMPFGRTFSVQP